jgi:hypothetical protein
MGLFYLGVPLSSLGKKVSVYRPYKNIGLEGKNGGA